MALLAGFGSTLDAVYVYEVPWSEFPIVPLPPHYPHGGGVAQLARAELDQTVVFDCPDLYNTSSDFGERQCKSRTWKGRFERVRSHSAGAVAMLSEGAWHMSFDKDSELKFLCIPYLLRLNRRLAISSQRPPPRARLWAERISFNWEFELKLLCHK